MSLKNSKLYVVATPIGNSDDITLRALKILKNVDLVICEEYKEGSKLLKQYGIKKPLQNLNEHNENKTTPILLDRFLKEDLTAALISDGGTPLFADPGNDLVWQCHQHGITVVPIPGASSIMAALMASGLKLNSFQYYGFLPANKLKRIKALQNLPRRNDLIFLETPYRLKQILRDMVAVLGKENDAILAYKLTQPEEKIFWGNLAELQIMTEELPKGEFVFILKRKRKGRK